MSMKTRINRFFGSSRQYVVVGASTNPSKFGFKILLWYVSRDLPVIPVNPKEKEILGQPVASTIVEVLETLKNQGQGSNKKDGISISFLTPPSITTKTVEEISKTPGFENLVKGIWFQPGSYDQNALDMAVKTGLGDKTIHEDECILVRGDEGMYNANL